MSVKNQAIPPFVVKDCNAFWDIINNSCFTSLFLKPFFKGWVQSELRKEKSRACSPCGKRKGSYESVRLSCSARKREKGSLRWRLLAKGEGVGGEEGRFWIRSAAPVLSGPVEPPSGSGFGVNMGPADPFLPQGTQTPGLPTFHFYFPGCKTPLAIRAGGVFFFFFL